MAVANEGRRVINCDRLTVVLIPGGRCRVEAISGSDWFDPRSQTVQALEQLAMLATATKTPFRYSSQRGQLPAVIEDACEAYFDLSNARVLMVVAMMAARSTAESSPADDSSQRRPRTPQPAGSELVGALIVEQFSNTLASGIEQRVAAVSETSALALANAVEHQGLMLLPMSRGMRRIQRLIRRPKAQVIGALLVVAAGVLVRIDVKPGMLISVGQSLARLDQRQAEARRQLAAAQELQSRAAAENDVDERDSQVAAESAETARLAGEAANSRTPGSVSGAELRKSRLDVDRARLAIERAQRERHLAGFALAARTAELQAAELDVELRQINAPAAGLVLDVYKHPGEWLALGEPMLKLVRIDRLKIEAFVDPAVLAPREVAGRAVRVTAPLERGRSAEFDGQVTFVNPVIEAHGKYRVWTEVDNRQEGGEWLLQPGLIVELALLEPALDFKPAAPTATPPGLTRIMTPSISQTTRRTVDRQAVSVEPRSSSGIWRPDGRSARDR